MGCWGHEVSAVDQVTQVQKWIESGASLEHTADYTRQLNVWDDDLRPTSVEDWFLYYVEASNLLVMAALHGANQGPYGTTWTGPMCSARAAVCAYKAMNHPKADREAQAQMLIDIIRTT